MMPIGVNIEFPEDCHVDLDEDFVRNSDGYVSVKGRGSRLTIGRPNTHGSQMIFEVRQGASVVIGPDCTLGSLRIYALCEGVDIRIGRNSAFNGTTQITAHEAATIGIGENCLFGPDCTISASDVHKIYSVRGSKRLNAAGDIMIRDRVWIGPKVAIFRNSSVGPDSVVGWSSTVKGHFPNNVVVAGSPARVIKKGIRWEP